MVNQRKGAKQTKADGKSEEIEKEIVNETDGAKQEKTAAKRQPRNKTVAKINEESEKIEQETKVDEMELNVPGPTLEKKANGKKRKAEDKETDVAEKGSKAKISKTQAEKSEGSENGSAEVQLEGPAVEPEIERGGKAAETTEAMEIVETEIAKENAEELGANKDSGANKTLEELKVMKGGTDKDQQDAEKLEDKTSKEKTEGEDVTEKKESSNDKKSSKNAKSSKDDKNTASKKGTRTAKADHNVEKLESQISEEKSEGDETSEKGSKDGEEINIKKKTEDDKKTVEETSAGIRGRSTKGKQNTAKGKQNAEKLEDEAEKDKLQGKEDTDDKKNGKKGAKNSKTDKNEQDADVDAEVEKVTAGNKKGSSDDKGKEESQMVRRGRSSKFTTETEKSVGKMKRAVADETTAKGAKNSKTKSNLKDSEDKSEENPAKKRKDVGKQKKKESEPPSKKARLTKPLSHPSHHTASGIVLTVGSGDTGQLGLGPDVLERGKPGKVEMPSDVVQICAGGMHSVCLTANGEVYTFGCNDEGSLGRKTPEEEDCMEPGKVDLPEKIIQVSAGDSHSAALSESGQVYIWGTFRDANGSIGIIPGQGKIESPHRLMPDVVVNKISSGGDHLVLLSAEGDIYTMGAAEQGQLGRVAECFSVRGGRKGLEMLLVPSIVKCQKRHQKFADVWAGQYVTFAKAKDSGEIYGWGLNNYYQLGFSDMRNKFVPEKSNAFAAVKDWKEITGGQHHTIALDKDGLVYSLGRKEYGRLGLGSENLEEKKAPTLVTSLKDKKCVNVSCGSCVSFAVDDEGKVYGWGMGNNKQLGQGEDEEDIYEPKHITSKHLDNMKGLMVSAGGQHTIFLARNNS